MLLSVSSIYYFSSTVLFLFFNRTYAGFSNLPGFFMVLFLFLPGCALLISLWCTTDWGQHFISSKALIIAFWVLVVFVYSLSLLTCKLYLKRKLKGWGCGWIVGFLKSWTVTCSHINKWCSFLKQRWPVCLLILWYSRFQRSLHFCLHCLLPESPKARADP